MSKETRGRIWRLILGTLLGILLTAYFLWSFHKAGTLQVWHVIVLVLALLVAVINYALRGKLTKNITKYIGFEKEPEGVGIGVRREYFMAHAPMYFIISAYLMQAALKDNSPNVMTMILSFLILIFALNLVFAALWKKLSEGYLHFTHRIASALSLIGIAVFAIDLLTIIANLTKAGVNGFVTTLFLALGLLLMLGIAVFYLISIPPQD